MKRVIIRLMVFTLLLVWCAGFANSLFLDHGHSYFLQLLLHRFYSPVCHQLPERTIIAGSGSFLICSRCTGIYTGALLPAFFYLFKKEIRTFYLIPALILLLADVLMVSVGIYNYSKAAALLTGLLLGFTLFPYILSAIEKSFSENEIK